MFSKSLRLPLFGLLGMAALATGTFLIFSMDDADKPVQDETVAETTVDTNETTTQDDVARFSLGGGEDLLGNQAEETALADEPSSEDTPVAVISKDATSVPAKIETPSTKGQVVEYKIKSGDVISRISRKFGCKDADIYRLNAKVNKSNANKIRVGQTIKVIDNKGVGGKVVTKAPSTNKSTDKAVTTTTPKENAPVVIKRELPKVPEAPKSEETRVHVFKSGETPFTISKKYYGTIKFWSLIKNANPHWDMIDSPSGVELKIPSLPSRQGEVVSNKKSLIPSRR